MTTTASRKPSPVLVGALLVGAVVVGLGAAFGLLALLQSLQPHSYQATIFDQPLPAEPIALVNDSGEPATLADFDGKLVLLYFGYTTCPDFCPDTLNRLARARDLLGADAERVQVVMVTVDPERDTLDKLHDYMRYFDESFIALSGGPDEIADVAARYGIYYAQTQVGSSAGYLVDHTVTTQILNGDGERIGVLGYGLEPDMIADDLRALLRTQN